jgi:hypothetical protein
VELVRRRMADVTVALKYEARAALPRGLLRRKRKPLVLKMKEP